MRFSRNGKIDEVVIDQQKKTLVLALDQVRLGKKNSGITCRVQTEDQRELDTSGKLRSAVVYI